MTPAEYRFILPILEEHLDPERVHRKARLLKVLQRVGKIDPYVLLVVVILAVTVRGPKAIADLSRTYRRVAGIKLARSSFWSRFNRPFSLLVRWVLDELVAASRATPVRPGGVLAGFVDVIAVDGTVIKVDDSLRSIWKGCRTNSAKAAVKIHAWVRVLTGELVKYRLTKEAYADCRGLGVDASLRGTLLLFDRGYASPSLWRRIDSVGGYFLTRIPAGWNQEITNDNRRHRGRARSLVGLNLKDALDGLHRELVDVMVSFSCRVRGYGGNKPRKVWHDFRVVAVKQPDGTYHLYATNAPESLLPADKIRQVYRLRWEAETFFKILKSGSGGNELPSAKRHTVEAFLYAGLIRASLAMRARVKSDWTQTRHINPLQWVRWWATAASQSLSDLLACIVPSLVHVLELEDWCDALADPNRARQVTRLAFTEAQQ